MEPERQAREVHAVASAGFGAEAEAYDRSRPSYPPDAVAWLTENLRIGPGRRVADLAAGTGKLTALLRPAGADLVAIEPVAAMRARLRARLPGVPALAAVAEGLPFAAGSLDAVVVAQAFHWFDADRALAELARVVRPGGRLGVAWNARARTGGWADDVWAVMDRVERHAPWRDDRAAGPGALPAPAGADGRHRWSERLITGRAGSPWSPWIEATFYHDQVVTPEDVVDRIRSVSHVAALPPARQGTVLDEVRAILRDHPGARGRDRLQLRYRVDALYSVRLDG
ncbi:MAG TPA: class I SAM-dependent methyltransferase [Streptosporangiaceae bacterium]